MKFKDYTIDKFLEELKGDLSSPGGGSTAALVSSLAMSLNSMVYSFTVDKKSFEKLTVDQQVKMREFKEKSDLFVNEGLAFMEGDRKSFMDLMDSFKLPKDSEEEKNVRSEIIRKKTIEAMEIPLNLAKNALTFYENINFAVDFGNKNLTSDGIVAAILLHSAIESAVVNVFVNYNSLGNKEGYEEVPEVCKEIIKTSLQQKEEIVNKFY